MDHSLQAYFQRRTTAELFYALKYYMDLENWRQFENKIRMVLRILREREKVETITIPPAFRAYAIKLLESDDTFPLIAPEKKCANGFVFYFSHGE